MFVALRPKNLIRFASLIAIIGLFVGLSLNGCGNGTKGVGATSPAKEGVADIHFRIPSPSPSAEAVEEGGEATGKAQATEASAKTELEPSTSYVTFACFDKAGRAATDLVKVGREEFKLSNGYYCYSLKDLPLTVTSVRATQFTATDEVISLYVKSVALKDGDDYVIQDPYFTQATRIHIQHKKFELTPKDRKVKVGDTIAYELIASVNDVDNKVVLQDMLDLVTWDVDDNKVVGPIPGAGVGIYTARAIGTAHITATYIPTLKAVAEVVVYDPTVVGIEIGSEDKTITVDDTGSKAIDLALDDTAELSAYLIHEDKSKTKIDREGIIRWSFTPENQTCFSLDDNHMVKGLSALAPGATKPQVVIEYLSNETQCKDSLFVNVSDVP